MLKPLAMFGAPLLLAFCCLGCGGILPQQPPSEEATKLAAQAARSYVREVAANYEQLSRESFTSVSEAMRRNVELDAQARSRYGEALKAILKTRIVADEHSDRLSPQAAATFRAMARGFAEVAP